MRSIRGGRRPRLSVRPTPQGADLGTCRALPDTLLERSVSPAAGCERIREAPRVDVGRRTLGAWSRTGASGGGRLRIAELRAVSIRARGAAVGASRRALGCHRAVACRHAAHSAGGAVGRAGALQGDVGASAATGADRAHDAFVSRTTAAAGHAARLARDVARGRAARECRCGAAGPSISPSAAVCNDTPVAAAHGAVRGRPRVRRRRSVGPRRTIRSRVAAVEVERRSSVRSSVIPRCSRGVVPTAPRHPHQRSDKSDDLDGSHSTLLLPSCSRKRPRGLYRAARFFRHSLNEANALT
jgi:hypothetical protein